MPAGGLEANPLPGDEVIEICRLRQIERGVPEGVANQVCTLMSTVLSQNGLKNDGDLLLVPTRFTKEGVHNGRLKPWSAIKNAAATLVGTPFYINQPEEHVDGIFIDASDKTRWHGIVAQVDVNEGDKALDGFIGLFSPDAMKANGASEARIRFQEALLKAVSMGGRFAVSTYYGARIANRAGHHEQTYYGGVEEQVVFTSISIVPRGAEASAIMAGPAIMEGEGEFQGHLKANGVIEAAAEPIFKETAPLPNESINNGSKHKRATMPDGDAASLRDVSLDRLRELLPQVQKLADERDSLLGKANAATTEQEKVKADVDAGRKALANTLDSANADKILRDHPTVEALANYAATTIKTLANKVTDYRTKEEQGLKTRIEAAEKVLAPAFPADKLALFKDEKDLAATANRLETMVESIVGSGPLTPAGNGLGFGTGDQADPDGVGDEVEDRAFGALEVAYGYTKAPATKVVQ